MLGMAARALHRTLLESSRGLACPRGELLVEPAHAAAPAVISLPLELGPNRCGAFCLLRKDQERGLSELDFEILDALAGRSEEHTSELQSLMRISYPVFCLKTTNTRHNHTHHRPAT